MANKNSEVVNNSRALRLLYTYTYVIGINFVVLILLVHKAFIIFNPFEKFKLKAKW